jgi:hypothetical protein
MGLRTDDYENNNNCDDDDDQASASGCGAAPAAPIHLLDVNNLIGLRDIDDLGRRMARRTLSGRLATA